MDHAWAARQLKTFLEYMDALQLMEVSEGEPYDEEDERTRSEALREYVSRYGSKRQLADKLISLDPIMRDLMNAAQPELGDYHDQSGGWSYYRASYWFDLVRYRVLQAIGIHELGEEARLRMQPDSPDLVADQLHPWVWEAAAPMWRAGSAQEAVHAAARSVNARLQQKLGRHDVADARLCREAFSLTDPVPGQPRLRFAGDRTSETWRSRQNGGTQFGAGCFEGIRNITAHVEGLELPDQVALEQLAAFSVLARWIDECEVEVAASSASDLALLRPYAPLMTETPTTDEPRDEAIDEPAEQATRDTSEDRETSFWRGFTQTDMRLLVVTFAGTVAANVVTVLVVAGAIIQVRYGRKTLSSDIGAELTFLAIGTVIVGLLAIAIRRMKGERKRPPAALQMLTWTLTAFVAGLALALIVDVVGVAAGVK